MWITQEMDDAHWFWLCLLCSIPMCWEKSSYEWICVVMNHNGQVS